MIVLSALTSASLLSRHAICVCDVLKQVYHHIESNKFEDFITINIRAKSAKTSSMVKSRFINIEALSLHAFFALMSPMHGFLA
jgi:hypothetical protein